VGAAFFEGSFRKHLSSLGLTRFERFGVLVSIYCVEACSHFILGRESSECSWFGFGRVPRSGITVVLPSFFLSLFQTDTEVSRPVAERKVSLAIGVIRA
jgi:hypothetical protein